MRESCAAPGVALEEAILLSRLRPAFR
jgi:hypothetical protein